MSSQYGEHTTILDYFKGKVGRFLDIGAFDGFTFSNTQYLADLGWSGVCVEPSPISFRWLMHNYQRNRSVALVNAAIGERPSVSKFWVNTKDVDSPEAMSTFEDSHRSKFPHLHFSEMWAPMITWELLLEAHPGPYDFVNIDVEGMNERVLALMPLRPSMVCVEADPINSVNTMKWDLEQFGLKNFQMVGGNILAWA
jgi:FkbM family methyltransferase